jgi:hypothetical protein
MIDDPKLSCPTPASDKRESVLAVIDREQL